MLVNNAMVAGELNPRKRPPHFFADDSQPQHQKSERSGVNDVSHDALSEVILMRSEIAGLEQALKVLKGSHATNIYLTFSGST